MFESLWSWWFPAPKPTNPLNPQGIKPCCACPETKKMRDECFMKTPEKPEVNCKEFIEKHRTCMMGYGFKV